MLAIAKSKEFIGFQSKLAANSRQRIRLNLRIQKTENLQLKTQTVLSKIQYFLLQYCKTYLLHDKNKNIHFASFIRLAGIIVQRQKRVFDNW